MSLLVLLAVLALLALNGCGTTRPAPVYGWDWSGPVPEGYYLIRRGDTLVSIARRHGVSMQQLASLNRLQPPYRIYAGTLLRVTAQGSKPVPSSTVATRPAPLPVAAPEPARPGPPVSETRVARSVPASPAPAVQRTGIRASTLPGAGSRLKASGVNWQWPLNGPLLKTFKADNRARQGIRIGGQAGQEVRAAADGQVVYSGSGLKGYGNLIIVKHNAKYLSAYGFNRLLRVREGQSVKRGQAIAEVGRGPDGSYLMHFEIRRNGTAVDPILYLPVRH